MRKFSARPKQLHSSEKMPRKQLHSFRSLAHCQPHQAVDDRVERSGWGLANGLTQRRFFTFRCGAGFDAVQKQCANSVLVELHGDNTKDCGESAIIKNEVNASCSYCGMLNTNIHGTVHCNWIVYFHKPMLTKVRAILLSIAIIHSRPRDNVGYAHLHRINSIENIKYRPHILSIQSHCILPYVDAAANGKRWGPPRRLGILRCSRIVAVPDQDNPSPQISSSKMR